MKRDAHGPKITARMRNEESNHEPIKTNLADDSTAFSRTSPLVLGASVINADYSYGLSLGLYLILAG